MESDNRLQTLIDRLVALGEDAEELEYWKSIFNDLDLISKERLLANLREEAEKLESLPE